VRFWDGDETEMESVILHEALDRLKASCLAEGIRISETAIDRLSEGGTVPLTVHEYATTGGITLEIRGQVFVNAPFDDWYCGTSTVELDYADDLFLVRQGASTFEVTQVLRLPGYLNALDSSGRKVTDVCMSHADRIRLSPIAGCVYDCAFCDIPGNAYRRRSAEQLVAALNVAAADEDLPARHVLISGGSPGSQHNMYFQNICCEIARACPIPVDIMMAATNDPAFVDRVVDAGVSGFSLNIELYGDSSSQIHIPRKHRKSRPDHKRFAARAVERLGRNGSVRSLILVGLEPIEDTLAGVKYLARLGVDPVLSPFRPARNTKLEHYKPPSPNMLVDALGAARDIVREHGVRLGPRCVPCQHNTLTLPWDVETASPAPA
jgi:pyruvate-formate lyase-activating enzyme